jgi:regulator of protease activity HflC (stomatin/prohibitin superfamily)
MPGIIITVAVIIFALIVIFSAVKVVKEYERGVVFRFGRYVGIRGPGLIGLIPLGVERMTKIGLRTITMDVPAQEAITRDNITVKVDAVVYFRVIDASEAVLKVQDYINATSMLCQTTLRNVVGQSELDEVLAHRDKVNEKLQIIIDEGTAPWGIKVSMVEIKDVQMPPTMQRAMAAQAEAERERRAKVVHADGEFQAAQKLADAAHVINTEPAALQLRYLQTLITIATEKTNTIVFPLPIDLISKFIEKPAEKK